MLQERMQIRNPQVCFSGRHACPPLLRSQEQAHARLLAPCPGGMPGPSRQVRRLKVQAGLNYPHMPNRYRRRMQDWQQAGAEVAGDFKSRLMELPLARNIAEAYERLINKLQPLFAALARGWAATVAWWELRKERYYEFCAEETKRKWRWKAYRQQEWDWWAGLLQAILERSSVMIFIIVWELTAPTTIFMTLILPLVGAMATVKFKSPLWPYMLLTFTVMVLIKLPWGLPIRFI